jgi:peroxiredoxin
MIAVALCGCASTTSSGPRKAADFSLRDLDGKTFHLSDHLGKDVVVMSFWATWCVPCIGEMPHLDRIYKTHKDQGLVVLGISLDGPETVAQVGPTAHRLGVTYPILLDEETRVVQSYNPRREAPFTVIIDRAGTITSQKVGHSAGDEVALEQELVALLSAAPGAGQ